jgi:hypothetical protein
MKKSILFLIILINFGLALKAQKNLIADYPLLTDGKDITGNNDPMTLTNTPFQNEGIYCNGIYPNGEADNEIEAYTPPINNFNFNAFSISVDFFVAQVKTQPVIICGSSCRWLGFYMYEDSTVELFYNNSNHLPSEIKFTPNEWHNIQISYQDTTVNAYIDNYLAFTLPVVLEYAVCGETDTNIGVVNYSNGEAFEGYIRNLKIYSNP